MDYTSVITNEAFQKLQCDSCTNYLSYFPIYIFEEKKNICGRCSETDIPKNCVQNEVYEVVAQFIKFPCRYKSMGCPENAIPKDMIAHENICDFKLVKCPLSDCKWEGALSNVLPHSRDQHSDLMFKNGVFSLDMNQSYQRDNLMEHDSVLFIIKQKFYAISKLLEFSICNTEYQINTKEIPCELNFETANRRLIVQYCINDFDNGNIVEIPLDSLKDCNNSSLGITGKISFRQNAVNNGVALSEEKVNRDILEKLKCSTCGSYSLPPIYSQKNNSKIECFDCKNALSTTAKSPLGGTNVDLLSVEQLINGILSSPQTSSGFSSGVENSNPRNKSVSEIPSPAAVTRIRNLSLEDFANSFNYPCKYENHGCTYITKPPQMRAHLRHCPYSTHKCPFRRYALCNWTGTGIDLEGHVINAHENMILKSSTITEKISACNTTSKSVALLSKYYIIRFAKHLFLLYFSENSKQCLWCMQMLGHFERGFMFELIIMDRNKSGRSLVTRHPCFAMTEKTTMSNCYFYKSQLADFVSDQTITFCVEIYKQENQCCLK